jgi:hypothetical protein
MNSNTANGGRPDDFCRFTYAPTTDSANAPDLHKLKGKQERRSDGRREGLRGAERSTLSGGGAGARTVVSRCSWQGSPGKVISQASSIRGWLQLRPACRRLSFSCRAPKAGVGVKNTSVCASKGRALMNFQNNTGTAFTGGFHMCSVCVPNCSTNPYQNNGLKFILNSLLVPVKKRF